jgi:hypothetical protein
MKETELRLGNLVMVNHKTDLLAMVTWIQEKSICLIFDRQPDLSNGIVCSPNDLIPIPLTEEWLLKFGFIKMYKADNKNGYGLYSGEDIYPFIAIELYHDGIIFINNGSRRIEHIKYVHQLQNLYFALTGEELNIQL